MVSTKKKYALLLSLLGSVGSACAQLTAVVAIEPTSRKDGLMVSRTVLESNAKRADEHLMLDDLRRAATVVARTLLDLLR